MKAAAFAALLLAALVGVAAGGCTKPVAAPEAPRSPVREPIEVMAPGGERTLRLDVEPDGYTLRDQAGWSIGRAIIDARSVRVTDRGGAVLVTVSRTASGFVLEGGGERLEGALKDEGLVLTRGKEPAGLLSEHALKLPDRTLFVVDNDALVQVVNEGGAVLEVRGHVGDGAVYLAWKELSFPERLALMLFSAELL